MTDVVTTESGLQDMVIGLVAPIGTELDPFSRTLGDHLQRLGYAPRHLKLSDLLKAKEIQVPFKLDLEFTTKEKRYENL